MLNVEFKVNGQLVGYMNVHNESTFPDNEDKCRYSFKFVSDQGVKRATDIIHLRSDGLERLVEKCLAIARKC